MRSLLLLLLSLQHGAYAQLNTTSQENYLKETELLNYSAPVIQQLISEKKWLSLSTVERVKSVYNFVRDDIKFGYNVADDITAEQVLKDGYGQCNTKSTLLMALLRACEIPNRIHGFTINKELQKGAVKGIGYTLSPKEILHSWVEVYINPNYASENLLRPKTAAKSDAVLHFLISP